LEDRVKGRRMVIKVINCIKLIQMSTMSSFHPTIEFRGMRRKNK
jgi:hypothetical protein